MAKEKTEKNMTIEGKLSRIQAQLNAPKNQKNSFGKYSYRSCEDILQALKPLLAGEECYVTLNDDIVSVEGRVYVKAIARISDCAKSIESTAFAREPMDKKGMDAAQLTGSCSSYARKYALNGLFAIDDCKDADTMDNRAQSSEAPRDVDHDPKTGEAFDDGAYESGAVYKTVQNALKAFAERTGYKKADISRWVKQEFDGRTLTDMKNDDGLLLRVLKAVERDYTPSNGDDVTVGGAIPGKVV